MTQRDPFTVQRRMAPLQIDDPAEFRGVPPAEIVGSTRPVPCPDCGQRVRRGEPPNPLHPACAAHLP